MAETITPFPSQDPEQPQSADDALTTAEGYAVRLGDWIFQPDLNRLTGVDGEFERLEPKLADLLALLTTRHGQVVSKDDIVEVVWEGRFIADSALTRAMAELRRALGDDAHNPVYIETISKKGYRLLAVPRPVSASTDAMRERSNRRFAILAISLTMIVAAGLAYFVLRPPTDSRPPLVSAIVVLPLEDLSAGSDNEYFATSMTEALTTDLAQAGAFRVLSRRSIERFEQDHGTLSGVALALGADAAVEGSVVRADGRVRINVQLTDAASETHLWAESYEREFGNVLALQNEVAGAIVAELTNSVAPESEPAAQAPWIDPEAHDLYLQARHLLHGAGVMGENEAPQLLDQVIAAAPDFAPAYAAKAKYYSMLTLFDYMRPHEGFPRARVAATQALEIDQELGEAHAALAHVEFLFDWDWAKADVRFRRAIEFSPTAQNHHAYSFFLTCMARFDAALEHARREIEIDPLNNRHHLGWVLFNARRYEESIREIEGEASKHEGTPMYAGKRSLVGWNYAMLGRYDEAIEILEASIAARDFADPVATGILGWTLAASGRPDLARDQLNRLEEMAEESREDLYPQVVVYAGLGEVDRALDLLEQAVLQRSPNAVFLSVEPFLDPIRDHPRYQRLLANTRLAKLEPAG